MPKNFYNLPSPWNPGLAIPRSVMDEGLQRHAYTTRWAPRGTYDAATNGNQGNYAIPQYILEEGTGRGAFTSAWPPRGYSGPDIIQHWLDRQPVPPPMSGLGADMPPDYPVLGGSQTKGAIKKGQKAFQRFGQRSAKALLRSVAKVPPQHRA